MKKDTILTQVVLEKVVNKIGSKTHIVVWVEAEKAKVGSIVLSSDHKDKSDEKTWWRISKISNVRAPYDKIAGADSEAIWYSNPINTMKGNK